MARTSSSHPAQDRNHLLMFIPAMAILVGEFTAMVGEQRLFSPFQLDLTRYGILRALVTRGRLTMSQLKESIFVRRSASKLTFLVDSIEVKGLVKRIPSREDRRSVLVEITAEGRELLDKVDAHYLATMQELMKDWTLGDLQTYTRYLIQQAQELGAILGLDNRALPRQEDAPLGRDNLTAT